MNFGTLPPVGGPFACPLCLTPVPGFNKSFGTFGKIPPFPPFNPSFGKFGKIPPFPPFNPSIGTFGKIPPFPGICTTCI